jgi:hypothetical protein
MSRHSLVLYMRLLSTECSVTKSKNGRIVGTNEVGDLSESPSSVK